MVLPLKQKPISIRLFSLWRCSWRFHDASCLYSDQRGWGASAGSWPDTQPAGPL